MRVPSLIRTRWTTHAAVVQLPRERSDRTPASALGEHPSHPRRGHRIRLQHVHPTAPARVHGVRMRTTINQPIPIRWAATQETALLPRLHPHRRYHPLPRTRDLTLCLSPQQHHQRLVNRAIQLDRTTSLRQPHLHTHRIQPRHHLPELITMKRTLILPHQNRIELQPHNPNYAPIPLRKSDNAAIIGKVIGLLRGY